MKRLLLAIALVAVVGLATEMEAGRIFNRRGGNCSTGSCSRPARNCKKSCVKRSCKPRCKAVCPTCPETHEVVQQPTNERCIEKTWCRLVEPEKTVVIPARYEKVTCVTKISEGCCVTVDGCSEADYQANPNIAEAPRDVHNALNKVSANVQ